MVYQKSLKRKLKLLHRKMSNWEFHKLPITSSENLPNEVIKWSCICSVFNANAIRRSDSIIKSNGINICFDGNFVRFRISINHILTVCSVACFLMLKLKVLACSNLFSFSRENPFTGKKKTSKTIVLSILHGLLPLIWLLVRVASVRNEKFLLLLGPDVDSCVPAQPTQHSSHKPNVVKQYSTTYSPSSKLKSICEKGICFTCVRRYAKCLHPSLKYFTAKNFVINSILLILYFLN